MQNLAEYGLVFSIQQNTTHEGNAADCGDCLLVHGYVSGMRPSKVIPAPPVHNWRVSIASKGAIGLGEDVAYGRSLYEHSVGRAILDQHGITQLNLGCVYDVNYLTMYHKARLRGWDDDTAHRFAFIRGNVYSLFVSLLSNDKIVEFSQ
jgi:hypothetical protein